MVIHRQFDSTNGPTIDSNIYYYYRQMSNTTLCLIFFFFIFDWNLTYRGSLTRPAQWIKIKLSRNKFLMNPYVPCALIKKSLIEIKYDNLKVPT